jgi:hypothetical protein
MDKVEAEHRIKILTREHAAAVKHAGLTSARAKLARTAERVANDRVHEIETQLKEATAAAAARAPEA